MASVYFQDFFVRHLVDLGVRVLPPLPGLLGGLVPGEVVVYVGDEDAALSHAADALGPLVAALLQPGFDPRDHLLLSSRLLRRVSAGSAVSSTSNDSPSSDWWLWK